MHDFTSVDRVYDLILEIGLRPVVEIGFMPRDLASDPSADGLRVRRHHLAAEGLGPLGRPDRAPSCGTCSTATASEVLGWDFEVWNEANLEVFWSGTRDEWMRLYDVDRRAVKGVDPRIAVGGPSSAAAGWVDALLDARRQSGVTGRLRLHPHLRQPAAGPAADAARASGVPDARILWTEWGVTPTHFNPSTTASSSATFLLTGMRSAAGRVDALSYWVASDHFEELGRPPRLLHGGFGLITVGGIAKPRYHALRLLAALGDAELPVTRQRRRRRRAGAEPGPAGTGTAAWPCCCGRPLWTSPSATVTRRWPAACG